MTKIMDEICNSFDYYILRNNCILIDTYWAIGLMVRVFADGPEDQRSIPGRVLPKIL